MKHAPTGHKLLDGDIPAGLIKFSKIRSVSGNTLLGRGDDGPGPISQITLGANLSLDGSVLSAAAAPGGDPAMGGDLSGTASNAQIVANAVDTTTIANDAVTYAKIQNVAAASKLLGRGSAGGSGNVEEITVGSGLSMSGTTLSASAAAVAINQCEVDFGAVPVWEASFTVTDAGVSGTSQLIGSVAYEAPTGKDLDELDMDGLDLKFAPGTGEFTVYCRGLDGPVHDKFKLNYLIG